METMSFWRLNEILTQRITFGILAKMIFVPSVMFICMLQLLVWAHKRNASNIHPVTKGVLWEQVVTRSGQVLRDLLTCVV